MAEMKLDFPPIGFGAFKIGRNLGVKYAESYPLPTDVEADRLLNGVLDLGICYIDTAPAYGLSEERIGESIGHRRGEFILSTKVGESFENGASRYDFSRDAMERSVRQSVRRLRTERVDVLFLHAHRDDLEILRHTDAVETLIALRDLGIARAIGFSGYSVDAFRASLEWADAVMVEFHRDDVSRAPVVVEAGARGIVVVVKKGLASGRIQPGDAIPFVLGRSEVSTMLVGSLNLDHLRDDLTLGSNVRAGWRDHHSAPAARPGLPFA